MNFNNSELDYKGTQMDFRSMDYKWLKKSHGVRYGNQCYKTKNDIIGIELYLNKMFPNLLEWDVRSTDNWYHYRVDIRLKDGTEKDLRLSTLGLDRLLKSELSEMADEYYHRGQK